MTPSFRTHNSSGRTVYEFWTVRMEEVFSGDKEEALDDFITKVEEFLKQLLVAFLEDMSESDKEKNRAFQFQVFINLMYYIIH